MGGQSAALRNSSEEAVTLGLSVWQAAATAAPRAWLTLLAALEGRPDYDDRLTSLEAWSLHTRPWACWPSRSTT